MVKHFTLLALLSILIISCSTPKYFNDPVSFKRQKELKKHRTGNIFGDIGMGMASVFTMAALNVDIGLYPGERQFKKLKLINPSPDTLYVNMLTDVYWDEDNYCDFMDIRIPPKQSCKVLVPVSASYNLYFRNTAANDDEMLEIFTDDLRKVALTPGMTLRADSLEIKLP